MYGAVEGAALSAVPSDGERLCCPMIDLRTEADLLRRWPAAVPGAGAAIAKAAATGRGSGAMFEAKAKIDVAKRVLAIARTCLAYLAEQLGWLLRMVRASLRSKQTARFCGNGSRASGVGCPRHLERECTCHTAIRLPACV